MITTHDTTTQTHSHTHHATMNAIDKHYTQKPTDKNLSAKFDTILPDTAVYRKLQDLERRMDATFTRKRLDLGDLQARMLKQKKTLRLFVSNTSAHQAWQIDPDNMGDFQPPSWTLNLEGNVEGEDKPFSSYFTSISVEVNGEIVEWHEPVGERPAPPVSEEGGELSGDVTDKDVGFDVFKMTREGSGPIPAKIVLQLKEYPDRARLSAPLSEILALDEATKSDIILALWQYIKFHDLQQTEEKRNIKCDEPLRQLFGRNTVTFPEIMELITPHLLPKEPLVINYTIDTDVENNLGETVFDLTLEFDDDINAEIAKITKHWFDNQEDIFKLDEHIALVIQQLNNTRLKREFFKQFAAHPSDFLAKWNSSQARDLKLLSGDRGFNEEEVRKSSFYTDEFMGESAHLLLARR